MIEERKDIDLPSMLAYLYQPVLPLLKKIHVRREGERHPNPDDILGATCRRSRNRASVPGSTWPDHRRVTGSGGRGGLAGPSQTITPVRRFL
jgi:hypothetical protein